MNLYSTELQPWPGQAPQDGDRPVPNSPSEDDHYLDDPIKYDLSVWLAELDDATDDVPQIPPAFIVYCRVFMRCPHVQIFLRKDGDGKGWCLTVMLLISTLPPMHPLVYRNREQLSLHSSSPIHLLTAEDIILSQKIEERANYVIQSVGVYAHAAAALVCIVKETGLLSDLFDCKFDTTGMVNLSKKIRQSAYELMLYEGPESAAAAGAMLGLAKEAKLLCYVLSREDRFITVRYLNYASDNGDVNVASAVSESEKPQGTVVDLKCASDNVDVNGASAGAKSEKPEGTVGYLNCEVSDSMEQSKGDLNDCCEMDRNAKFGFTINKDHKLEGEHLDASYLWKVSLCPVAVTAYVISASCHSIPCVKAPTASRRLDHRSMATILRRRPPDGSHGLPRLLHAKLLSSCPPRRLLLIPPPALSTKRQANSVASHELTPTPPRLRRAAYPPTPIPRFPH
ncbi:unnamed protein product [Miscanthus lutarioriparius]|uniref:Uncharacterized protein n=1 Tax=Miscanthus lutarioriparius TaxID=422564 RepID=A0A811QUP9_9POAL|nr:unnamed protein product [Miscanthus lutarioriparius]